MAVSPVTTPDSFALTKGGRMLYEFSGNGRYATLGIAAKAVLFVSKVVPNNTSLTLRWNNADHTLLFVDAPSAPNEFPTGDGSRAYLLALLAELKSYFPLREDFILTEYDPTQLLGLGIRLTARKPGPAYDISVNFPVGTPFGLGNSVFGGQPVTRPQYSVYAELWLQKVGTTGEDLNADFERIFSPMVECDESGSAQIDIGNVLHSRLMADLPTWNQSTPVLSQTSARKYFLCYGEAYGSPIQIGKVRQDEVRHALLGGVDYVHRAGGGLPLLTVHPAGKALRFGDLTRFVRADEPQFLSFLNAGATQAGCLLQVFRKFDNGNGDVSRDRLPAQDILTGQKITYPVGPAQLDLFTDLPAGRTLTEYTVQRVASDEVTALSEVYRFVINYDYQPYTRYFGYVNSLGCVDTIATFGKGSRELQRFSEQAERFMTARYELADGQFTDYNVSIQQSVEVATGFRSEAELNRWNDFYRSANRYWLESGRALPISVTSKSIQQAKDGDSLFAHKFAYSYLFQDAFYSDETTPVAAMPPPNFVPGGGTVVVQPVQTVVAADPTIPDVVRGLTSELIDGFKKAVAWGDHKLAGYLTQATAADLFRRTDQKVSFVRDLIDKPTTRDQAGIQDVPTRSDLLKIIHVKPHLSSWIDDIVPDELEETKTI